jgi:hypothetical protein
LRNFSSMSVYPLQALPPFESFWDLLYLRASRSSVTLGKPQ